MEVRSERVRKCRRNITVVCRKCVATPNEKKISYGLELAGDVRKHGS
jgi:hypothetical protein